MGKQFAYVEKVKHELKAWMRKKGSWRANCSCQRMLEKSGGLEQVTEAWKAHIREEGERREVEVFWYEYSN